MVHAQQGIKWAVQSISGVSELLCVCSIPELCAMDCFLPFCLHLYHIYIKWHSLHKGFFFLISMAILQITELLSVVDAAQKSSRLCQDSVQVHQG